MQIIPIRDLRDTNALSEKAHAKLEPIFVTKNGYGDLVVMSIETYEHITGSSVAEKRTIQLNPDQEVS